MSDKDHKEPIGKLLDRVNDPIDLRALDEDELPALADEVRAEILTAICETGGHLASSLGVVELTIAIHYVFNTPSDRLIWDVGHQTYPHKILTGRRDRFATIRCHGGLSGFPKRNESEYDNFGTGHASTSISAAMGMAHSVRLAGRSDHVVAVIGDGGLTGGLALEALNQTPKELPNLTVILNDNEMSIAPSVGRMSTFLSRSLISKPSFRVAELFRRALSPVLPPWLYEELRQLGRRWRHSFLAFWTPGTLFEALGYHYIGPIDGHRLDLLLPALRQARETEAPVLVHVLTKKGKGYAFAEERPSSFHGTGPFDLATGKRLRKGGPPSYTEVFADTMLELFAKDPHLIGITAAMPQGTGLDEVAAAFPSRVFDMGITEPHCVTFAAGMACEGYRPVVAVYSTFLQRAYDQVVHDVCLQNLPVIFCLDRAGIVGEDGPTHHGMFDLSYLRHMPNMSVLSPSDESELRSMLHAAAARQNGPIAIRYPRGRATGSDLSGPPEDIPWGKAKVIRQGRRLAIFALGQMVGPSMEAADILAKNGVSAWVVNARFVKPLDTELLVELAEQCNAVVTVEENTVAGGFGSAVLEALARSGLAGVHVNCLGLPDAFVGHGTQKQLREECGLDPASIAESCLRFLKQRELPFPPS